MMAEKKIQGLEQLIGKRNTQITSLKDKLGNMPPASASREQMQQVISQINHASKQWNAGLETNEKVNLYPVHVPCFL